MEKYRRDTDTVVFLKQVIDKNARKWIFDVSFRLLSFGIFECHSRNLARLSTNFWFQQGISRSQYF